MMIGRASFIGLIPRRWIAIAATQWQFLATELAGLDCLFENTLQDTFLDFVDWVSQKQSTVIEAKKKKRRSTSRRNNKTGSVDQLAQLSAAPMNGFFS